MTDVNIDGLFPSLEAQAKRLNEASDRANGLISTLEKRLTALNFGLEVWHDRAIETSDAEGDLHPDKTSKTLIQVLGFARVDGRWCLAVKPVHLVEGFFQGDIDAPFVNRYAAGPAVPLLKCSRGLRIASLQIMPKFLSALEEHVAAAVSEVETAAGRLRLPGS